MSARKLPYDRLLFALNYLLCGSLSTSAGVRTSPLNGTGKEAENWLHSSIA